VFRRHAAPPLRAPTPHKASACTAPTPVSPRCTVLTTHPARANVLSRAYLDAQGGLDFLSVPLHLACSRAYASTRLLPPAPQGSILGSQLTITQAGLSPARTRGLARLHCPRNHGGRFGVDVYPYVAAGSSTAQRMASAVAWPMPVTSVNSSAVAPITASTLPKCSMSRRARPGPMPGSPCRM